MYNFTVVVPTHNRHVYLKRSIEYFKNIQANVFYCDSSEEVYSGELFDNIKYFHFPGEKFANKILNALELIETDYVALCADDDFIIIESLYKGFNFLNTNKDFRSVVGKYISFKATFDNCYYPLYQPLPNDINSSPEENSKLFFSNYYQILWAMYDKKIIEMAFNVINIAKFHNDNFIELVVGSFVCNSGGIKFLDEIWGVRELSSKEHWGDKHSPIVNMKVASIQDDFKKFKELIDKNIVEGYADKVIQAYFKSQNSHFHLLKFYANKLLGNYLKMQVKKMFFSKSKELLLSSSNKLKLTTISSILSKSKFENE